MSTLNAKNDKEIVIQPDEKTKVTYVVIQPDAIIVVTVNMTVNIQGDTVLSGGR